MSEPTAERLKAAQEAAALIYEEIARRFESKRTCGADKDEFWWDWLAVWLPDQLAALLARREQALREERDQLREAIAGKAWLPPDGDPRGWVDVATRMRNREPRVRAEHTDAAREETIVDPVHVERLEAVLERVLDCDPVLRPVEWIETRKAIVRLMTPETEEAFDVRDRERAK